MLPTIGEQLQQARQERKLSIKKASQATAVRSYYLEAMEADDFEKLPSPLQARGFLRIYANYLGLDGEKMVAILRGVPAPEPVTEPGPMAEESPAPQPEPVIEAEPTPEVDIPAPEDQLELPAEPVRPERLPIKESIIFPTLPYISPYEEEETEEERATLLEFASHIPLSKSIFIEIGEQLNLRREMLSLTMDEIERHTHIRKHHLAALEKGAFEDLPSPVQARGMLTSYARFLDLDVESMLLRFADALQASRSERHPRQPQSRRQTANNQSSVMMAIQRIFSTDLVFGGGLIVVLLVFAIWGAARIIALKAEEDTGQDTSASISEELLSATQISNAITEAPTPTTELVQPTSLVIETPTAIALSTQQSDAPVQLVLGVTGRTWLRVSVDGKVAFEGRVQPGAAYNFDAKRQIDIITADGGVIQIIYNGEDLGPIGASGQIINRVYTAEGVFAPTATITPTPTRTPRPTATPRFTATPRASPTPLATRDPGQ